MVSDALVQAPFISSASSTHTLQQSFLTSPLSKLLDYLTSQLKSTALNFLHLNVIPIHPSVKYVLDQRYLGDITLVPDVRPYDYTQLLINPTAERLSECIIQSENSTWRLIPTIRGACEIEFALDECVRRMRGTLILEELSDARLSKHMSRVRSWSSDLLAVGQHLSASVDPAAKQPCQPCEPAQATLSVRQPALSTRTRSELNLNGSQLVSERTADLSRWNRKADRPAGSVPRSHTALSMDPAALARRRHHMEHEAEDDDVVSEEEEEEVRRRQQEQQWEVGDVDDDDNVESRAAAAVDYIDDEGIPRQRLPLHTPEGSPTITVTPVENKEDVAVAPGTTPGAAEAGAPSAATSSPPVGGGPAVADQSPILKPARKLSAPATAKRVNINVFSPGISQLSTNLGQWGSAVPSAVEGAASSSASASATSAPAAAGEGQTPVLPASAMFSPPTPDNSSMSPIDAQSVQSLHSQSASPQVHRRRFETERSVSAQAAPNLPKWRSARSASRPHTPDADVTLSRAEWAEEKDSPVLSQLLKTSQTKISVPQPPKRNVRPNAQPLGAQPSGATAASQDVALHIPSLVMFRHTVSFDATGWPAPQRASGCTQPQRCDTDYRCVAVCPFSHVCSLPDACPTWISHAWMPTVPALQA